MLTELRRSLPAVRALPGSAEAIPLPDASVDAVLAGNAMHWFDMAVAGPEIARVLAPIGILAGLWKSTAVDDTPQAVSRPDGDPEEPPPDHSLSHLLLRFEHVSTQRMGRPPPPRYHAIGDTARYPGPVVAPG
ncbi:class I SAM-dependent methyltransferase [Streptomyces sp. NPDC059679]|uniref:class I SAM-dependent methyltransferase n=1 Tax=Streptomyces sp. NPDC059679 TaxID=3346903 RepID=UPI0036BEB6C4